MLTIELAHTELARVRFAHSPVEELAASLRVLHDPRRQHLYGRWLASQAQSWWRLMRLPQVSSKTASMPP
jgi:hypothetical protein